MKPTSKKAIMAILVAMTVSSIILAQTAYAATHTVSVPEFTIKYVDYSYDVPTTYGTDPYTGETIIVRESYHVDNRTHEITITNQPFTPYQIGNNTVLLYYDIRSKGHYGNWTTDEGIRVQASTSTYTVVSNKIDQNLPTNAQIDFQVRATLSYIYQTYQGDWLINIETIIVAQSDWSETQTVGVTPEPTPEVTTPTQSCTQDPQTSNQLNFDWKQTTLIILSVVVASLVGVVIILLYKLPKIMKKTLKTNTNSITKTKKRKG
jgi:hypothetical protein